MASSAFNLLETKKKCNIEKIKNKQQMCTFSVKNLEKFTCSEKDTRLLAFIFCFETVVVPIAASVPELCTGIGLLVVVPADLVASAGALVQAEVTTGVKTRGL